MRDKRIELLRERMAREGTDALLVSSLPNVFYLSGFSGSTAALLLSEREQLFFADFRYHGRVRQEAGPAWEIIDSSASPLRELLPATASARGLTRIALEAEHLSLASYLELQKAGGAEYIPGRGWIEELRRVKDETELATLQAAESLGERIYSELLPLIGPDTREADLAAEIEYRARRYGASACSFSPIIASGVNSSKPHAGYSSEKLVPGAPLTIDLGVVLDGYCSDMTRTVFYKDCPPKWEQIYKLVDLAQRTAFEKLRPGVTGRDGDGYAREVIEAAGFGEFFGHGLGHGVGIQIHESPRLSQAEARILEPGNVTSLEPGIYFPGEGGVRIENLIWFTADGVRSFNQLGTELTVVG
ncbi:aminopeptidase P family protein [bacterium]|nr:aminopeptidase P family protein [bacterium]